jgi:hypothetical protein
MAAVRCRVVNKVERRGEFDTNLHMLGKDTQGFAPSQQRSDCRALPDAPSSTQVAAPSERVGPRFESGLLQRGVRCELDTAVRRSTSGVFGTPRSVNSTALGGLRDRHRGGLRMMHDAIEVVRSRCPEICEKRYRSCPL